MDQKIAEILPKIEGWLKMEEIKSFKIGVTQDIQQRSSGYSSSPNVQLVEIASGDKQSVIKAERDLIEYFLGTSLKDKCKNQPNTGGVGNVKNINTLYIAYEHGESVSIQDLHVPFNNIVPLLL